MSPTRTSVTRIAIALALLLGMVALAVPAFASTTVNGTLSNGDSTRNNRVTLNGTASTCANAKAFPGQSGQTGTRRVDSYTITNTTGATRCITVTLSGGTFQRPITSFAYQNAVPATLVATNYLGDLGDDLTGGNGSYSFNLANNQTAVIVVLDSDTNENQSTTYTVTYGAAQTITFANPGTRTFGDVPFALGGTASSGLTVAYASTTTGVCTVAAGTLTIVGAGSCTVNANQAGNAFYDAAPQVSQTFTVARAGQTISFDALTDRTYGDADFTLSATGGASGNAVTFSSATPAVCAVAGNSVSILAAGECTVSADQAGNANYNPAPQVQQSFTVAKKTLSVVAQDEARRQGQPNPSFTLLYDGFVGADDESVLDVLPTASSSADESSAPGSYDILVSGGSDDNYELVAGTPVGQLTVSAKEIPVISWDAPAAITYGTALSAAQLNATVSNGGEPLGALTYTPDLGAVLDAGNGRVLSVTYTPADSVNYATVSEQVQIDVLPADQAISFDALADRTYGDADFTLSATGGASGNAVAFSSATPAVCAVDGGEVSILAAGECTIAANQDGSDNYNPAPQVEQSFTVAKKALTATALDAIRAVGQPNPAFTVALSGFVLDEDESVIDVLPTASSSADESSAPGSYAILVSGGSDDNYSFDYVDGTLTVTTKDIPALTWAAPAAITYGTPLGAAQLNATASFEGQPVEGAFVYTPAAGTLLGAGNGRVLSVTFNPADSENFASVTRQVTIDVARAPLTITADNKAMVAGAAVPALTATYSGFVAGDSAASLDTPVSLTTAATSSSPAGTYDIVASGAADANYTITFVKGTLTVVAPPANATFTVYLPLVRR